MSPTTKAAESIAGNMDALLEILERLPAKSLTRFKLVSKQWLSHISDPKFIQSHSRRNPKLPTGMFLFDPMEGKPKDINFVSFNNANSSTMIPSLSFLNTSVGKSPQIRILQSCNGLFLCLVTTMPSKRKKCILQNYCVCNPTTRKYRKILEVPKCGFTCDVTLVFDPSVSPYYKVFMRPDILCGDGKCQIDIYSSEDQSVRCCAYPFEPPNSGLFLNGAIYWIGLNHAVCLDVYSETMKQMSMPPDSQLYTYTYLLGSGGRLYRTDILDDTVDHFRIFEISKDFSKWVLKYHIRVGPMVSVFPQIAIPFDLLFGHRTVMYGLAPLCIVEGLHEDSGLVLAIPGKIIWYNLRHKTVKELSDYHGYPTDPMDCSSVRAFQFVESLSSV